MAQLTLKLKIRWWLKPIMSVIIVVNCLTAWRPSKRFIDRLVHRAVYVESAK